MLSPREVYQDRGNYVFFSGIQDSLPAPGKFLVCKLDVPRAGQKTLKTLASVQHLRQK